MNELVNKEMILSYLRYLVYQSKEYQSNFHMIPIYQEIIIPHEGLHYRDYTIVEDAEYLLELIEKDQLSNEYIQEIIEFSIANL